MSDVCSGAVLGASSGGSTAVARTCVTGTPFKKLQLMNHVISRPLHTLSPDEGGRKDTPHTL